MRALVGDPALAVLARVAGRAGAGVGALAGVAAGGPVGARPVVGAVVEVLVAEESAPPLLAEALELVAAEAVHAARVLDALVAQRAGPPRLAPGEKMEKKMISLRLFYIFLRETVTPA